jgi:hypothetical protein
VATSKIFISWISRQVPTLSADEEVLTSTAQLRDALFPRQKYTFTKYTTPIKSTAMKLKNLCDAGHVAEQRSIKKLVENTDSGG